MALQTSLDAQTMEAAVLGGALLGCGGGGKLEDGLNLGSLATTQERATLVELSAVAAQTPVAALMPYYLSGSETHPIDPRQAHRALALLQDKLNDPIGGLLNGGLGAVDSIIGWESAASLNIPLLDGGIPLTHHPATLPNLLAHWQETAADETFFVSLSGRLDQGRGHGEYLWHGRPADLQRRLAELPAVEKESFAAAAGPLRPGDSRPMFISRTLEMGRALLSAHEHEDSGEASVAALQHMLPARFSILAAVTDITWRGLGPQAHGLIEMRDTAGRRLQLTYGQRYRELSVGGQISAVFPDLIITLGTLGTPLTGEEVFIGQEIYLIATASSLFG